MYDPLLCSYYSLHVVSLRSLSPLFPKYFAFLLGIQFRATFLVLSLKYFGNQKIHVEVIDLIDGSLSSSSPTFGVTESDRPLTSLSIPDTTAELTHTHKNAREREEISVYTP